MALMSDTERSFIAAILENLNDRFSRLVFADYLEEHGDPRAELVRLTDTLTQSIDIPNRPELETRLRTLLEQGVQPIGPFCTNSLGMKFAWISAGIFLMGSPKEEKEREDSEALHKVTLTKGFYMGVHTVTQEQWQAVMGNNPSDFKNEINLPVERVSWEDCQEFIKKLRDKDKKAYRLPSEAEWEFACRAGTTTPFFFGETISTEQANYDTRQKTTPVGSFPANAWGLFDMHGNVWEWCQDWLGDYPHNAVVDPQGPDTGQYRVLRGGSQLNAAQECRSAFRSMNWPGSRSYNCGLRVCLA
jgi:uncharacterized protein (TIGR02996 family)